MSNWISQFYHLFLLVTISLFSTSVTLCFVKKFNYTIFYTSHINDIIWHLSFSFCLSSLSMTVSRSINVSANDPISFLFMTNIASYIPPLLCPVFYWWAFRLLPYPGNCNRASMNMEFVCLFELCFFPDIRPGMWLPDHVVALFLVL